MKRFSPIGKHTRRWILKLLKRLEQQPLSIADIGCGEGSLLSQISHLYPDSDLYGCDFSSVSINICRKRIPQGVFTTYDIRENSNPFENIVDVGISSEVIEHIDDDKTAVLNMSNWCRNLILTVPAGRLDENAKRVGHLRHYDEASLRAFLSNKLGLEVVYCRTWGFPLSYPLYAQYRNRAGYEFVTSHYGFGKRLMTRMLYWFFYLNDMFTGGNKIFVLARNPNL